MNHKTRRVQLMAVAGLLATSLITAAWSSGAGAATSGSTKGINSKASLRVAYAGPSDSLDPDKVVNSTYPTYIYPIYDRLLQTDVNNNILPMLASSYQFSADGKSFTLHLRHGVVFHDGSPVNAAAVKASLLRGQTIAGSTVATELAGITAITVVDDDTVKLTLNGVGADLPAVLTTNAGAVMNPKVLADPTVNLSTVPPAAAGSGPYVVTQSSPNVSTSYKRAPQYWNRSAGLLSSFSVATVSSSTTRLSGLLAGNYDLIQVTSDIHAEAANEAGAGALSLVSGPSSTVDIMFNTASGDLTDVNVRKAITVAIDHSSLNLLQTCLPTTQPESKGNWAYNPNIKIPYNPKLAKQLISAKGGATFTMEYASGGALVQMATVLQSQLQSVGINVTLRGVQQVQLLADLAHGEAQAVLSNITVPTDPAQLIDQYFLGGENIARGALASQLQAVVAPGNNPSLSQAQRAVIYKRGFQLIADDYMYAPVCQNQAGWATTKHVVGLKTMPGFQSGTPVLTLLGVAAS